MITLVKVNDTTYRAAAPLDHLACTAVTPEEAMSELKLVLGTLRLAQWRMRQLKKASRVEFDPRVRAYVATCEAAGVSVQGFTRQDAWDELLKELMLIDKARMAEEAKDAAPGDPGHTHG